MSTPITFSTLTVLAPMPDDVVLDEVVGAQGVDVAAPVGGTCDSPARHVTPLPYLSFSPKQVKLPDPDYRHPPHK